ncbi:uncharacterized protein EKO05_0010669 [Ascochyta rabiei]|nr:uncharacterized protein EKO05_0010669 [Ascochyta rabiei]UPX20438.1 hypothetical protein EKO05_0010669 [Ascochyta rabiei]
MSTPNDETIVARPTDDTSREVRVIHALFPRECLSLDTEASSTYHNTGVQTLPPPNGDVYRIINGREPSQSDYIHNMGAAAIGRYQGDPRSNTYELMYGAACTAPQATGGAKYVDSGFQTADCNITRKALASAKVKASMTANKYRGAAAKAGYTICAESKDDNTVHSEQYPTTARLDIEGNLLDGNVESRHLPNIYGTLMHHSISAPELCRKTVVPTVRQEASISHYDAPTRRAAYPSPSLSPLTTTNFLPMPVERISALAPSSKRQPSDSAFALQNEYGHVGSAMNNFVVLDPAATGISSAHNSTETTTLLSGKNILDDREDIETPTKRRRCATPEIPQEGSISVTTSPSWPEERLQQDFQAHRGSLNTAEGTYSQFVQLQRSPSGDDSPKHTSDVIQCAITAKKNHTNNLPEDYKPSATALRRSSPFQKSEGSVILKRNPFSEFPKQFYDRKNRQKAKRTLETKRVRPISHIREQVDDSNNKIQANREGRFKVVPDLAEKSPDNRQSTFRATALLNETASNCVKSSTTSRTLRGSRQALAPYVPPAMRARARQALETEQETRSQKE